MGGGHRHRSYKRSRRGRYSRSRNSCYDECGGRKVMLKFCGTSKKPVLIRLKHHHKGKRRRMNQFMYGPPLTDMNALYAPMGMINPMYMAGNQLPQQYNPNVGGNMMPRSNGAYCGQGNYQGMGMAGNNPYSPYDTGKDFRRNMRRKGYGKIVYVPIGILNYPSDPRHGKQNYGLVGNFQTRGDASYNNQVSGCVHGVPQQPIKPETYVNQDYEKQPYEQKQMKDACKGKDNCAAPNWDCHDCCNMKKPDRRLNGNQPLQCECDCGIRRAEPNQLSRKRRLPPPSPSETPKCDRCRHSVTPSSCTQSRSSSNSGYTSSSSSTPSYKRPCKRKVKDCHRHKPTNRQHVENHDRPTIMLNTYETCGSNRKSAPCVGKNVCQIGHKGGHCKRPCCPVYNASGMSCFLPIYGEPVQHVNIPVEHKGPMEPGESGEHVDPKKPLEIPSDGDEDSNLFDITGVYMSGSLQKTPKEETVFLPPDSVPPPPKEEDKVQCGCLTIHNMLQDVKKENTVDEKILKMLCKLKKTSCNDECDEECIFYQKFDRMDLWGKNVKFIDGEKTKKKKHTKEKHSDKSGQSKTGQGDKQKAKNQKKQSKKIEKVKGSQSSTSSKKSSRKGLS